MEGMKGLIITGLITVVILVGGIFFLSRGNNQTQKPILVDSSILVHADSHKTASSSAKVTLVEFGDYQCPACGVSYPIVKQILKDYKENIVFVFRNYPLTQHANGMISAEAAEAAGSQGKYWEMHDKLYELQNDWSNESNPLAKFVSYAKDLGLDTEKFKSDVQNNKFSDFIQSDLNDGNASSINATPTFFINGQKVESPGVPSYQDLKTLIDKEISK